DEKRKNVVQIENFWQRQQKFFHAVSKALDQFVESLNKEVKYLGEHPEMTGMNKETSQVMSDTLSLLTNIFKTTNQNISCVGDSTFKATLKTIAEMKSHLTDENEEIVIQKYHQLETMNSWNIPLMYNNFLHPFITLFDAGSVFFNQNETLDILVSEAQELKQQYFIQHSQPSALYCNKSITSILVTEQRNNSQLPLAIESIVNYLYEKGFNVPGIFREITTGNKQQIDDLYHRLSISSFEDFQPDLVAAVFKKFLRELPEHLFDAEVTKLTIKNYEMNGVVGLKNSLTELLPENFTMFKQLVRLLSKITAYEDINLMNAKNLAVCLAPTLFSFEDIDTLSLAKCIQLLEVYISKFAEIFPDDVDQLVFRKSRALKRATKVLGGNDAEVLGMIQKRAERKKLPTKKKPLPDLTVAKQKQKEQKDVKDLKENKEVKETKEAKEKMRPQTALPKTPVVKEKKRMQQQQDITFVFGKSKPKQTSTQPSAKDKEKDKVTVQDRVNHYQSNH
ncbi:hypothetical protein EIN_469440, partial [Entamoeba invadens IP1]